MTYMLNKDVSKWTEHTYSQLYSDIKSHLKLQDTLFSILDETKEMEMDDIDDLIGEYQSREDDPNFNTLHLNVITQTSQAAESPIFPPIPPPEKAPNSQVTHPQQQQHQPVSHQSRASTDNQNFNLMQPPISHQQHERYNTHKQYIDGHSALIQEVPSNLALLHDPESPPKLYVYSYFDVPFISNFQMLD